ncbi:MAG: flagellar biosynthesis protein FliQ [Clostridia bacterium]|nr:flagellar biosynthesis protein FliQ [Clostridia bacterium]
MTQDIIIYLGREALLTVLLVSSPILLGTLVIGLIISIFQATTQIQEQTMTFAPKIVVALLAVVLFGPWMMNILVGFTNSILLNLHKFSW